MKMAVASVRTLWRGTTEPWEIAVFEGMGAIKNANDLVRGRIGQQIGIQLNTFKRIVDSVSCSQLRSGREMVLGVKPKPLDQLSKSEIIQGIVDRVGFESAYGTPNFQSHFVPCGTNSGISLHFGHGACYEFNMICAVYGERGEKEDKAKIGDVVDEYLSDKGNHPSYVVPLLDGGNGEFLAYTGTLITSVFRIVNGKTGQMHSVPFSLD
jgi:hypothetical protein